MSRLEILRASLLKKEAIFNGKISAHFATVKEANGQPLNDKRNGATTLAKWERQNDSIRKAQAEIEKTKTAIEVELRKISNVESAKDTLPKEILDLVESGELIQWRKFPNIFFVKDVEKGRISWDKKKQNVAHSYVKDIPNQEQRSKFVKVYNALFNIYKKTE